MKKLLATVLAAATVLCMAPAFAVSAAEPTTVDGLSMSTYHMTANTAAWDGAYKRIIGMDYNGAYVGYKQMKKFDQSIDDLIAWSYKSDREPVSTTTFELDNDSWARDGLGFPNGDNYLLNWTGTMTAASDVTFTVVANKIDNGFVLEVDDERYFEYWGSSHWFNGDGDRLVGEKTLTLKAGQSYDVNAWFLELSGGDLLKVGGYVEGTEEYKSFADLGITFDLKMTGYHTFCDNWDDCNNENQPYVKVFMEYGASKKGTGDSGEKNGGNGAQILNADGSYIEENRQYDETFEALMNVSKKVGGTVLTNSVNPWSLSVNSANYINVYNGYVTVENTGYYVFGCANVDNGLVIEIDGTRVFEFWCNGAWQDNGVDTWDKVAIKLEAGKTYPFYAAFMEINGGQVVDPIVKYAATEAELEAATAVNMDDLLSYTTDVITDTDMLNPSVSATVKADGTLLTDKIDDATVSTNRNNDNFWGDGAFTNVFDGNYETKLGCNYTDTVAISWQTTEPTTITHYAITTAIDGEGHRRTPALWTLLGSNDGETYTVIDHVSLGMGGLGCLSGATGMYKVDEPTAYTYYRIDINCASYFWGGEASSFAELELYNYEAPCAHENTHVVNKKDATATEPGYTGDTVCKDCGETVKTGKEIPATGTDTPVDPAPTGDAIVIASALAVLALGAVVVSKKRRITE